MSKGIKTINYVIVRPKGFEIIESSEFYKLSHKNETSLGKKKYKIIEKELGDFFKKHELVSEKYKIEVFYTGFGENGCSYIAYYNKNNHKHKSEPNENDEKNLYITEHYHWYGGRIPIIDEIGFHTFYNDVILVRSDFENIEGEQMDGLLKCLNGNRIKNTNDERLKVEHPNWWKFYRSEWYILIFPSILIGMMFLMIIFLPLFFLRSLFK